MCMQGRFARTRKTAGWAGGPQEPPAPRNEVGERRPIEDPAAVKEPQAYRWSQAEKRTMLEREWVWVWCSR